MVVVVVAVDVDVVDIIGDWSRAEEQWRRPQKRAR